MADSTDSNGSLKYLNPTTLERIKRLDVRAQRVVEGFLTGQHQSPYNGFAVEFKTHREYTQGDELKHIDWKVWSKTDRLYIKEYEEETNLRCHIVLDCSKSMGYGDVGWSKFDYAATGAASLAFLLQQQQDAVGLVTFNTDIDKVMPPRSSPGQLRRLMHEMEVAQVDDKTDVGSVFPKMAQQIRQRGMVVIFSDLFVDLDQLQQAIQELRLRKHEVIIFHVMHDDEITFPFRDMTKFVALESEDLLNTDPRALRKAYVEVVERYLAKVKKMCGSSGVDYTLMKTTDSLGAVLSRYLAKRNMKGKGSVARK